MMKIKYLGLCLLLTNTLLAQNIHSISAKELNMLISDTLQLIDVRSEEEFAGGHLKFAKCIDINDANFVSNSNKLDKNKATYIYCLSGARSKNASTILAKNGFATIYNLEGGFMQWRYQNYEIKYDVANTSKGLSLADYKNSCNKDKPILIEFYASWCGPCKLLKPIVENIAEENKEKLDVQFIDVDKNKELADALHIQTIPVLYFYKKGKQKWQYTGLVDKKTILKKMKL